MVLKCLKCGCTAAHKNEYMKGNQRYKCKNYRYQYSNQTTRGKPEKDKILDLILFLSGLSMNATAKIVGVTTQSVMPWIRTMQERSTPAKPDISTIMKVEMDEMYHYFKKKLKRFCLQ